MFANAQSVAIKWQRSTDGAAGGTWTDILDAAGATYAQTADDRGRYLRTLETATGANGAVATSASPAVGPVTAVAAVPTLSAPLSAPTGTAAFGRSALVPNNGTWQNGPTSYAYAWHRYQDGARVATIAGATGSSYTYVAADNGFQVGYSIVASNADGPSAQEYSPPGAVVAAAVGTGSIAPNPPAGVVRGTPFTVNWAISAGTGGQISFFRNGSDNNVVTIPAGPTSGTIELNSTSTSLSRLRLYGANGAVLFTGATFTPAAA